MKKGAIRWRKGELIGTGAFGRVYMGMHLDSGELLAVKQILERQFFWPHMKHDVATVLEERLICQHVKFLRGKVLIAANSVTKEKAQAHIRDLEEEVKLLRNLSHPNIVRYLGTAREEEALNIFLEFVPGGSIASLLGKFGSFPEPVLRMYTKQLLQGLDYLHRNGIMHRDIKGANILVDNKGCIKLADFGASKQVVQLATMTGAKSMKGTPYWMAPEVIRQTGHGLPADIWSVGCTIIEMATGKPPWSQQFQEVAALFHIGTTKSHPPIPEHLSSDAKDFLLKCLRKEPHLRPTTSELLQHPFIAESLEGRLGQRHTSPSQSQVGLSGGFPSLSSKSVQCSVGKFGFGAMSPLKEEIELGLDMMDQDTNCSVRLDSIQFDTSTKDMFQSFNPLKSASNFNKSLNTSVNFNHVRESLIFNPMCEPHRSYNPMHEPLEMDQGWRSQMDAKLGLDAMDGRRKQGGAEFSFDCVLGDEDEEVTESKIKAFLDEKAMELKKLQTPLYEEFNSMWNVSGQRGMLKSPVRPRRRSNSRSPTSKCSSLNSGPSMGVSSCDSLTSVGSGSPVGGNNQGVNLDSLVGTDGFLQEIQQLSPGSSERHKLWKEELQRELEKKREERQMLARLGGNSNASSPNSKSNSPNKKIGQRNVARRLLSSVSPSQSPSARLRRD